MTNIWHFKKFFNIRNYFIFQDFIFFLFLYLLSSALTYHFVEFIAAFCTTSPSAINSLDYLVTAQSHTAWDSQRPWPAWWTYITILSTRRIARSKSKAVRTGICVYNQSFECISSINILFSKYWFYIKRQKTFFLYFKNILKKISFQEYFLSF